jgi:hypothetical protein
MYYIQIDFCLETPANRMYEFSDVPSKRLFRIQPKRGFDTIETAKLAARRIIAKQSGFSSGKIGRHRDLTPNGATKITKVRYKEVRLIAANSRVAYETAIKFAQANEQNPCELYKAGYDYYNALYKALFAKEFRRGKSELFREARLKRIAFNNVTNA